MGIAKFFFETFLSEEQRKKIDKAQLTQHELRWHYNIGYFAECAAVKFVQVLLQSKKDPHLEEALGGQLKDELKHVSAMGQAVRMLGVDHRARHFGETSLRLALSQPHLTLQLFTAQVLIEGAACVYNQWKSQIVTDSNLIDLDNQIFADEERHHAQAFELLSHLLQQEGPSIQHKQKDYFKAIHKATQAAVEMCRHTVKENYLQALCEDFGAVPKNNKKHMLDSAIPRRLIVGRNEFLKIAAEKLLSPETTQQRAALGNQERSYI